MHIRDEEPSLYNTRFFGLPKIKSSIQQYPLLLTLDAPFDPPKTGREEEDTLYWPHKLSYRSRTAKDELNEQQISNEYQQPE
ncbi:hypothetical protein WA026_019759 [Henosepilachna vigintioctopunctata]|uniref:Uncharacterized protein n=1 Tax=Henosepilachna vigintioctopunctata TaxID=420089 RepID=A0AAW1UNZ4_9CUCU